MSASQSLTGKLQISLEDMLWQVQALKTADQGEEDKDMLVALTLCVTHFLLIMIICVCLIDGLIGFTPLIYSNETGS